jgi:hypothetical protein
MKIPIKYGLLSTLGVMAWVLISHSLITNPDSIVHRLGGPVFFNILEFAMIYLGLKALEHEKRDAPTFKEGLKTGVAISFVYGLITSIFFVAVLAIVGTKWMTSAPGAANVPLSRLALGAFLAFFVGAMLFGLIYSTVLSFFVAKRRSEA